MNAAESSSAIPRPKLRWFQYRLRSLLLLMLLVSIGLSGWLCVKKKRVTDALKSTTQIEFVDCPLLDVVDYLQDLHHIQIRIDRDALHAAGIKEDSPVTKNLNNLSLQSGLRLTLQDMDLTYVVRDNAIWITTPQEVPAAGTGATTLEMEGRIEGRNEKRIAEALKQPTVIEFVDTPFKDVLDYLGDLHHIDIQLDPNASKWNPTEGTPVTMNLKRVSLQSALRLMLRQLDLDYAIRDEVLYITSPQKAAAFDRGRPDFRTPDMLANEKRIAAALESPTQIEFSDMPLKDVVDWVGDQHKIVVHLAEEDELKQAGVSESTPVACNVKGVSLRSALSAMLDDLGLKFEVRDEVLLITPKNNDKR